MKKLFFKLTYSLVLALLVAVSGFGQRTITGTITDAETGETLIGANVLVVGFDVGTITDIDGNYSLSVPEGATSLQFSYTGYTSQTVTIGASDVIDIVLSAGELLEEIVVTGYGTQTKKEVTGSIVSVKSEDFNRGNVNSPQQLLQGKVAGLTITRPGGDPNGSFGIRLRGLSTIGAQTEPLVIVDGVPGASLSNIDPMDIESIDVLKDGSAAAIYGTRGSSGVILVTTKKGKKGTSKIEYNGYIAAESISKEPAFLSAAEFREAGGIDAGGSTDWYDEIGQSGITHSHNLSLSGGSEKTTYRASMNFRDARGIVVNTGFSQLNGSLALTQKALDDKLSVNVNFITTNRKSDFGFSEAFRYASIFNPTSSVFKEDGSYNEPGGFDVFNPVAMVEQNINDGERTQLLTNIAATYEVIPGLKIMGSFAKQKNDFFRGEYYPRTALYRQGQSRNGVAVRQTDIGKNDLYETTARYTGESGNIIYTVLGGYSFQEFTFEGQGITAGGFLLDNNTYNQIGASAEVLTGLATPFSYSNGYKLEAQFGRVNINVDDTYFFSASVRREGSDRFGEGNKHGIFPAASAGIDISKLSEISGVDNLKVRLGYGVTGNLPGQSFLANSIFSPGAQFFYNGAFVPSYGPTTNANPDLKWETKTEINLGIDFALMDFKITGTLDLFSRKTEDLILFTRVPVPPNLANFTWKNVAAFTTSGAELALTYNNLIGTENLTYSPSLIFTTYNSVLDEYLEDTPSEFRTNLGAPGQNITDAGVGLHLLEVGEPIGQIVAPNFAGVDENGAYIFEDVNGDGAIDAADWTVQGNGLPDFELSLNNDFTFGDWDLNLFFRGAFGHKLVNTNRAFYEINPDIKGANIVRTDLADPNVKTASYNSVHVEDASFIRLDNASLGYNLDVSDNSNFQNVRLFIAGQNLFTITGYTGVDPDVRLADTGSVDNGGRTGGADPLAPGVDRRNTYFLTRTLTFGVNVGF
ncbi:MAG: SusC/RagA family TonB-linked outer membrane protein [Saprospiraceae bacterium]|nr:SusC/RagA family TonB-linked outer membrane protein [Saprospiraceae bacterium]